MDAREKPFIYKNWRQIVAFVTLLLSVACGRVVTRNAVVSNREVRTSVEAVNINIATEDELQKVPRIGPKLAKDIVEYRNQHGPFRRPEHLMLIQGISDQRFREIREFIRVE